MGEVVVGVALVIPLIALEFVESVVRGLIRRVVLVTTSDLTSSSASRWRWILGDEYTSHLEEQTVFAEEAADRSAKAGDGEAKHDEICRRHMRRALLLVCRDRAWDLLTKLGGVLGIVGFFRGA